MSSYLLALTIGDLASHTAYTEKSKVLVRIWSWKEMGPHLEFAAAECAR